MRRTVTNEVGLFAFPALQPGPYTVRAELSGFRPIESRDNMVLANNRLALPPLRLEVGTLAEAVTVSAVGEVVATTQTSHQAVLDLEQVENLSIRGRDPMSLLKILPGVQLLAERPGNVRRQLRLAGAEHAGRPAARRSTSTASTAVTAAAAVAFSGATNMDAIAEVNVQMSAYTAEYGLKGGAQVNFITKHGGAEYHGTGYWYKRHERLNATNYFNKINNRPKPQYRYSNLGGTLGGPIPKIKGSTPTATSCSSSTRSTTRRLKDVQNAEVLSGADGARARRRLLAVGHAERRADSDARSADTNAAVSRQQDSRQPHRSARPGVPEPVADAEHDGRPATTT